MDSKYTIENNSYGIKPDLQNNSLSKKIYDAYEQITSKVKKPLIYAALIGALTSPGCFSYGYEMFGPRTKTVNSITGETKEKGPEVPWYVKAGETILWGSLFANSKDDFNQHDNEYSTGFPGGQ